MNPYAIELGEGNNPDVSSAVEQGLMDHAFEKTNTRRHWYWLSIRDENKTILAGATGFQRADRLYISSFWVKPSERDKGIGRTMLEKIEGEARRRACHCLYVDTASWQAPGYYERHGFKVIATVPDYLVGHDYVFLKKDL